MKVEVDFPNKPTVSVDVKKHFNKNSNEASRYGVHANTSTVSARPRNPVLHYTMVKISLSSCLFSQYVLVNLHTSRLHIKQQ